MTANRGGKEAFIMNTFKALRGQYDCWFLADQAIAYRDEISDLGGHVVDITPRGTNPIRYLRDLRALFRSNEFEAIWLNQTVVNSIEPLILAKLSGVPYRILHSHSSRNMGSRLTGTLHRIQRPLVPLFANRRFACARPAAKWLFGNRPYTFIPNAFDVSEFTFDPATRESAREELGIDDDQIALVHVARFGEEKNHAFTVQVLNELIRRGQPAVAIYIGDGSLRAGIEEQVDRLGLREHTRFLGMIPDVAVKLQASDVSLLPSFFEGLPFTVLEAQAAGLPSIVSTAVTDEVDAAGTVRFLPLEAGAEVWADEVLSVLQTHIRPAGVNPLVGTAFDSAHSSQLLVSAVHRG
ncbi:glycosyltransferase [Tessaracoccus oleiagri]|nr:glycosyltransferase [Tessaracoccus oleiagri]